MTLQELVSIINQNAQSRFKVEDAVHNSQHLENLAVEGLNKQVIRVQRSNFSTSNNHWKTLLVVSLNDPEQLKSALEWAALTRDYLLDPETADLYLFICYEDNCQASIETCLRIESTEHFCRKYVVQPNENEIDFIARTFLATANIISQQMLGKDPLVNAFSLTQKKHPWFIEEEQKLWKKAFSEGLCGPELIESIFNLNR